MSKFAAAPMSLFGFGCLNELPALLRREGLSHALLVTDEGLWKCGVAKAVGEVLETAGFSVEVFHGVTPNPTLQNVEDCRSAYKAAGCDCLVAVGGGSACDCAKAVRTVLAGGGSLEQYQGGNKAPRRGPFLVAVNTTAGTGSEVSRAFLITDPAQQRKLIFKDDYAMPDIAVDDEALMMGLPSALTAQTGMDALTHAMESLCSTGSTLMTETLALDAVRLTGQWLEKAVTNPEDRGARHAMACAQYLAGLSFGSAGLGLVHAMAHQLGALYNLPHGLCNAVLLPAVLRSYVDVCPEALAKAAAALMPDVRFSGAKEAAHGAVDCIEGLSRRIGTHVGLETLGAREEDLPQLVRQALEDGCLASAPVQPDAQQVETLYRSVWKN